MSNLPAAIKIRPAGAADVPTILQFIRGLAEYERAPEQAVATADDLLRDGFGAAPRFRVLIAEHNATAAGFAFFFFNYSTWLGRPGLYLEDLFVRPEFRGQGIGKALLLRLARIAVEEGCARFDWQVLDWNTPAIEFYQALGAQVRKEWLTMRVEGEALRRLAAQAH
ncbi:MAG: GNAT family N-acetyltransferase [Acidobacteria bacterium]|nr:GNAT family N-acetyltransferase [Acidobacteriota bacterium]